MSYTEKWMTIDHMTAGLSAIGENNERMSSFRSDAVDLDISTGGDAGLEQQI